jgi:hypothetical protein
VGYAVAAFSLGVANKLLEPVAGAVLAKILLLVALILFLQRRPQGLFPRLGREDAPVNDSAGGERQPLVWFTVAVLLLAAVLVPAANLLLPVDSPLALSSYTVSLLGKYLCYAMLALALDLLWGYAGLLSLGHGAFFALGGYAMGMYLMRQIGERGVYGDPLLPDFMVFLTGSRCPGTGGASTASCSRR